MKLLFLSLLIFAACSKSIDRPQTCGFVWDKYFESPPGDSSSTFRTYWLRVTNDTSSLPPPNVNYVLQVSKAVYDTMLIAGQPYPVMYCY